MSFIIQNFFSLVANYNITNFPVQLVYLICGTAATYFLFNRHLEKNLLIGALLAFLWTWVVIVYHVFYFHRLQPGMIIFGMLFILQGIFLFLESFQDKNLIFDFKHNLRSYLAVFFIFYGLFIYPVVSFMLEGSLTAVLSLGLTAPIVILTFGFLMLTNERFSRYLLIIPTLWAVIGSAAVYHHGFYQDIALLIAAVTANLYLLPNRLSIQAETVSFRY